MKVIYDMNQRVYCVEVEYPEIITIINTEDIVEAREEFIKNMTSLFNYTICKQLNNKVNSISEPKNR